MSSVYIFGNSAKATIINEKPYITNIVIPSEFIYYDGNSSGFGGTLIKDFLVDEPIEITNILIQFYGERAHSTKELYWTDKRIGLQIRDSIEIFGVSDENTFYDISGSEHDLPFSEISVNKIIEANKNFSISMALSKTYPSHKPSDVILTDTPASEITAAALPFHYVLIKLYYNYK